MRKNARVTKEKITRVVSEALPKSYTDWARVDAKTDEDIDRDIASDPDASPIWTDEDFANAVWVEPQIKTAISIRVDPDVLAFFKSQGSGYQSRMNAVLRSYMAAAKRRRPKGARRAKSAKR